jgi:hypothetical protein
MRAFGEEGSSAPMGGPRCVLLALPSDARVPSPAYRHASVTYFTSCARLKPAWLTIGAMMLPRDQ